MTYHKHHSVHLTIRVDVPDGVYLPDQFRVSEEERQEARGKGLSDPIDIEQAEREWAMFNIAKCAFEALGIIVTFGSASSHGSVYRNIDEMIDELEREKQ